MRDLSMGFPHGRPPRQPPPKCPRGESLPGLGLCGGQQRSGGGRSRPSPLPTHSPLEGATCALGPVGGTARAANSACGPRGLQQWCI